MRISRLTDHGISRFRHLLQDARIRGDKGRESIDLERHRILADRTSCRAIRPQVEIDESEVFSTRLELAEYLLPKIQELQAASGPTEADTTLWSWLALAFFWNLVRRQRGAMRVTADPKYILDPHPRRFYRHLVAFPVWALDFYGDSSQLFLFKEPAIHSDVVETLASREETLNSTGVIDAAYELFWDSDKNSMKTGSNPNNTRDFGVRYFERRLRQFGCTFDLRAMSGQELIALMPDLAAHFGYSAVTVQTS